ncbi:GspMb/PilO family protein [Anaeromicrobium sediminis]|uniref:Type IV pilus assembly protein PilO n=1 Tax=Anaeromicrobium sediminis TaxID=1478221 RepID=A0A267MGB4_9FIRM|nr:GspMb/PilO family protein [Anaeromicrobium sediminis]PAB58507.1 hypothetical protein CCE28_14470 [Anaeromicrobium sediminis]
MKLTKREKILLIFLGVLIVVGAYYKFAFVPHRSKIKELETNVEAYRNEVNKVKMKIGYKDNINKNFKIMNSKIEIASERLFPMIIQEKIIVILDDMVKKSNIQALSMSFTEEKLGKIEIKKEETKKENYVLKDLVLEYEGTLDKEELNEIEGQKEEEKKEINEEINEEINKALNGKDKIAKDIVQQYEGIFNKYDNMTQEEESDEEESEGQLEKISVTISYEGSYNEIMAFVKEIESFPKKIIINSLNITKSEEGQMAGNIILDFYAIPKIHMKDEDYLKWHIENDYGKDNPFNEFSGYTSGLVKKDDNTLGKIKNYEFVMTVKPVTADIPTVVMGRVNSRNTRTYVHADNPNFENVEFQIIEEDGKYYYKYKTESESYPRDYENGKVQFRPKGDNIVLNIISNKRNSSEDISGVNLSLINTSNLKLNVKIDYDDLERTRVNVIKNIGNIEVKR